MAVLRTPPFKVTGLWELRRPWEVNGTQVYTCIAIRKFDEILLEQRDVYQNYYYPHGLPYSTYETDRDAGASIVTILSEFGEEIHVPDTFIVRYPEVNLADYQHIVLSASLGPLPSKVDLTNTKKKMATLLEGIVGKKPTIKVHTAPVTNAITVRQAKQAEQVRQAAVTDRSTTYATVSELEKKYSDTLASNITMRKYISQLETEKQKLLESNATDKLKEENKKLTQNLSQVTAENVTLKKEKEKEVEKVRTTLNAKYEADVHELKQQIFQLQEQLKEARKRADAVVSVETRSDDDRLREKILAEQEAARRRSTSGLQDSVRAQLEKQSQGSSPSR